MSKHHAVLGVAPGATADEVHAAFRRAARRVHPDAGGDAESFRRLTDAYTALTRRPAPIAAPTAVVRRRSASLEARRWLRRRIARTRYPRVH